MVFDIESTVELNNGVKMPRFGLGTYRLSPGKETYDAVRTALEVGYRLIDTASYYANEKDVGRAIRDSGLDRDQVFVTTKLYNQDQGYSQALKAFSASQRRLDVGAIDMYLIHWPVPALRQSSWKALETLLKEERCRSIGVSNYAIAHLEELGTYAETIPAVNQVELSPFLQQTGLTDACRSLGVQVESYSPLTRGKRFGHRDLQAIAGSHGRSPAQVMLRWGLQKGFVIIPKAAAREHIIENAGIFDFTLSEVEMGKMSGLESGLRVSWDPTGVP
jgi:diketogulonate reductase-like aldo/keto reductase